MSNPVVLETLDANSEVLGISQAFALRFQQEMENVARVALDAAPELNPADGWRYDVLAGKYVKLALPTVEAASTEPTKEV